MPINYPTSLDALANPGATTKRDETGFEHHLQHANVNDIVEALEARLGIGATNNTPVADSVYVGTGTGTARYLAGLTSAYLAANAATNSQLVAGSAGNVTTTSTSLADLDAATMSTAYVSSGGVLIAFAFSTVNNDTLASYTTLGVSINGTDFLGTGYQPGVANYRGAVLAIGRVSGLAAGTYTIKPRWRVTANTGLSVGGERWMLIVELKR